MYHLAGAIMRLHIKAALNYTVHTGYIRCTSLLVQLCVYTSKPHLLTQCIQATYAVPPCWCNHAFTHQSRISLHSVYRLTVASLTNTDIGEACMNSFINDCMLFYTAYKHNSLLVHAVKELPMKHLQYICLLSMNT